MAKTSRVVKRKITSEGFRKALAERCILECDAEDCYAQPVTLNREICQALGMTPAGQLYPEGDLDTTTAATPAAFLRQEASTIGRRVSPSGRVVAERILRYLAGII